MFWKHTKKPSNKIYTADQKVKSQPLNSEQETKPRKKLPVSFLKRLIPIGNLADTTLQELTATVSHHQAGEIVFQQHKPATSLPYLVKGQVFVEMNNGSGYEIDSDSLKAHYPLSCDSFYQCTAIAKSKVSIIHFPLNTVQKNNTESRNPLLNLEDIPEQLQNNSFLKRFLQHFKQGKLIIPSLPDVSLKLRAAVQQEIGIQEAVKIINLDSIISSKIIQIVNSPLYRGVNPISTSLDAISRLGLTTTRNLVTSISMQNIFSSPNKQLNNKMHLLWEKSIQVSSISHTLASITKIVNPDEALLAGLIHNIGSLPVIIFADSLSADDYTDKELNQTVFALQGQLGNIILEKWKFPETLIRIPVHAENWFYTNDKELDLSDIVLLAKFHSYLGTPHMQNLPPIHTLPAFQKLGSNALTPDMSLQTLQDAKQQISDAMSLFSS